LVDTLLLLLVITTTNYTMNPKPAVCELHFPARNPDAKSTRFPPRRAKEIPQTLPELQTRVLPNQELAPELTGRELPRRARPEHEQLPATAHRGTKTTSTKSNKQSSRQPRKFPMTGVMPKSSGVRKWAKHGSTGSGSGRACASSSELSMSSSELAVPSSELEVPDSSSSALPSPAPGGPAETPGPPLPAPGPPKPAKTP